MKNRKPSSNHRSRSLVLTCKAMRRAKPFSVACLVVIFWLAPPLAVAGEGDRSAFDETSLDVVAMRHLQLTGIRGMAIAITKGPNVGVLKGYGYDGAGAPMTEHTPMYIGSLSKSFTAVAVMQLVEAGKVNLDEPVHHYLPEFQLADARYVRITVGQLLNHSSGMADEEYLEWSIPGPKSLQDAVTALHSVRLVADPGKQFNYHNPNFAVAARLVEVISEMRFSDYLRERVFQPLEMRESFAEERLDRAGAGVPPGHVYFYGYAVPFSTPEFFFNGAGGVVSTASDMARWLIFQSSGGVGGNGVRLLSEASMKLMHTASAPGERYGFGWVDGSREQPPTIFHAGWTPTFTAFQSLALDGHSNLAILSNGGRTFLQGSGAPYVATLVQTIEAGGEGQSFGESTRTLDIVLSVAALLMLTAASHAILRNRSWAARARGWPRWKILACMLPWTTILLFVVALPKIVFNLVGGRSIAWSSVARVESWEWLFYLSPVGLIWCVVVALSCVVVIAVRVRNLIGARSPPRAA